MNRMLLHMIGTLALAVAVSGSAWATPSTIVWIPSADIQAWKTAHLTYDTYIRTESEDDGTTVPPFVDLGLTGGVLPFEKIQAEIGFDLMYGGYNSGAGLDKYPLYLNGKVGTPEGSFGSWSPAVAVGIYNVGTENDKTDLNMVYGIVGKTLPYVGRLEAGYYVGNEDLLLDADGDKENKGILLSWDRTMKEISDKLWVGVDYQGGDNAFGAFSFGAAWAFSSNTSVIFGYDIYNDEDIAGKNTATVQLDINIP